MLSQWRQLPANAALPEDHLSFYGFYAWVENNYREYLNFRTSTSVRYDVELWFDQELKQTGQR